MEINTKQVVKGTAWMSASTAVVALFQILSLVVLTRFLTKSEFGIVAIVTMVLGIVHTMADLGFSAVVMHKSNLSEKEAGELVDILLAIHDEKASVDESDKKMKYDIYIFYIFLLELKKKKQELIHTILIHVYILGKMTQA